MRVIEHVGRSTLLDDGAAAHDDRVVAHLADHREVEDAWLEYLVNKWEPWAQEGYAGPGRLARDLDVLTLHPGGAPVTPG